MSTFVDETRTDTELAPAIEDLSTYIISGRVVSKATEDPRLGRTVARGVQDGVDAEKIGFRRIFISERPDIKDAGVILGGIAALTSRLELGTGAVSVPARHPRILAAMGATMHAAFGPRFILGLGRTHPGFMGQDTVSYAYLADFVSIIRRLWAGETFDYEGPAGNYRDLLLQDTYHGPPPEIWGAILGGPLACRSAANIYDGVILTPMLTPDAVAQSVRWITDECDRIGRDRATIRICHPLVTAPELDDLETRLLCHARAVTYFQAGQGGGEAYMARNGWDTTFPDRLRNYGILKGVEAADRHFHRSDLLGPAELIPDEWMKETCAYGSLDDCVESLQRFRDAGADELIFYGSAPEQNARLADAWRMRGKLAVPPSPSAP